MILVLFVVSCSEPPHRVDEKEIVEKPEEINKSAEDIIEGTLTAIVNKEKMNDSFRIRNVLILKNLYSENSFKPLWSTEGNFLSYVDSFLVLIDSARNFGLLPENYYKERIEREYTALRTDTSKETRLDAARWAYADLLLSSALVQVIKDLKVGRLLPDSIIRKDSLLNGDFFSQQFQLFRKMSPMDFATALEPINTDYSNLKSGLQKFLEKASFKKYTYISTTDSTKLPALVYHRIAEEDSLLIQIDEKPDSLAVVSAIKKYQKRKKLKVDGKISKALVDRLNNTDLEKFIRIAITLDRYKMLPKLPEQYVWVNIPAYNLQVRDSDTVVLQSKVVVGKDITQTPVITSAISDMITYPKWHIPESIIKKEILPGLKKDPGYTVRRGYSLVDSKGNEIDPYSVKWSKFKNMIPYRVIQGSGDDNALGVIKFNFPNKFAVYLHDTNQRYLFSRTKRSLSHGCVRVESWMELASFILKNDSLYSVKATPIDSLTSWLERKEKRVIPVRKKLPLFIRYFTCEADEGKIVFHEDIYGEDRKLREKILSN